MEPVRTAASDYFLEQETQFRLGGLITEQSHPATKKFSTVAQQNVEEALRLLNVVDRDIPAVFERLANEGILDTCVDAITAAILRGNKVFFTGCGATGRVSIQLESWWRCFWQELPEEYRKKLPESLHNIENCVLSVIAGGDYALITSVEEFEDYTIFGRKQIQDLGVTQDDVVLAVTEGGETSHVIGTALAGVDIGAAVFFVYNNPDDILCNNIGRSRSVIQDPRIMKINMTTGPQAIAGSTRMQAASIETLILGSVLEVVLYKLLSPHLLKEELAETWLSEQYSNIRNVALNRKNIPDYVVQAIPQLVNVVRAEAETYKTGGNFFSTNDPHPEQGYALYLAAKNSALVVLTDTTERSPTFSTPAFRRQDRPRVKDSPIYLALNAINAVDARKLLLKRELRGLSWDAQTYCSLLGDERFAAIKDRIPSITNHDILQFVLEYKSVIKFRPTGKGNVVIGILLDDEDQEFVVTSLREAKKNGAQIAAIIVRDTCSEHVQGVLKEETVVFVRVPSSPLRVIQSIVLKMILNMLSTTVMALLGRIEGNFMTYVTPTNKKLIDRATRLVSSVAEISYDDANRYVFVVLEQTKELRKKDVGIPAVVNIAVVCARTTLNVQEAIIALQKHNGLLGETLKKIVNE